MNKNITVLAAGLATAIAFGAFVESANAQALRRRLGNTYSQAANNEEDINSQFTLVDTTKDGIVINDKKIENRNVGLFVGAIENYALAEGEFCTEFTADQPECIKSGNNQFNQNSLYIYDSSGFPLFLDSAPLTPMTDPVSGDLLVQILEPGQDPLLQLSEYSDVTTIAYSIIKPGTYNINEPEKAEQLATFRLLPNVYSNIADFDIDKSINSLDYILENNVLSATSPVIDIYYDEQLKSNIGTVGIGDILLQNKFEQNVSTTPVPEPGTILGTLAALSVGTLIKRTKQH